MVGSRSENLVMKKASHPRCLCCFRLKTSHGDTGLMGVTGPGRHRHKVFIQWCVVTGRRTWRFSCVRDRRHNNVLNQLFSRMRTTWMVFIGQTAVLYFYAITRDRVTKSNRQNPSRVADLLGVWRLLWKYLSNAEVVHRGPHEDYDENSDCIPCLDPFRRRRFRSMPRQPYDHQ